VHTHTPGNVFTNGYLDLFMPEPSTTSANDLVTNTPSLGLDIADPEIDLSHFTMPDLSNQDFPSIPSTIPSPTITQHPAISRPAAKKSHNNGYTKAAESDANLALSRAPADIPTATSRASAHVLALVEIIETLEAQAKVNEAPGTKSFG